VISLASARPAPAGDYGRCGIRVASLNAVGTFGVAVAFRMPRR
jgi:hypothetical protein